MGSFPYPPNGIVEIDYEFIHIFKKPGQSKKVPKEIKEASKLTKEEWKEYFSGHWYFGGAKQIDHEAMFPEELPHRLIKMFSFVDDTVLDPFLGSGTTAKVSLELQRNFIGYEINKDFINVICKKLSDSKESVQIIERKEKNARSLQIDYVPTIKDARPQIDPQKFNFKGEKMYKVVEIVNESSIKLDTGLIVKFLGVRVDKKEETTQYLYNNILRKDVILTFYGNEVLEKDTVIAYVYLKNKIFVNSYLIKSGLASPDLSVNHKYKDKFIQLWKERVYGKRMDSEHSYKQMGSK